MKGMKKKKVVREDERKTITKISQTWIQLGFPWQKWKHIICWNNWIELNWINNRERKWITIPKIKTDKLQNKNVNEDDDAKDSKQWIKQPATKKI